MNKIIDGAFLDTKRCFFIAITREKLYSDFKLNIKHLITIFVIVITIPINKYLYLPIPQRNNFFSSSIAEIILFVSII